MLTSVPLGPVLYPPTSPSAAEVARTLIVRGLSPWSDYHLHLARRVVLTECAEDESSRTDIDSAMEVVAAQVVESLSLPVEEVRFVERGALGYYYLSFGQTPQGTRYPLCAPRWGKLACETLAAVRTLDLAPSLRAERG